MPAGITQLIDRQVSSSFNFGSGDVLPGQSVASGTGSAQYQGIVGARIAMDANGIRFTSSVGTLFGGIYEYVFMTYTTQQPARGALVFWDTSVAENLFQVNGDAKPSTAIPTLVAGITLFTLWTKNTYGWMQIAGRATVLPDSSITSGTAGSGITAKVSATVPSTVDSGTALAATTAGAIAGVDTLIGIAEATVTASTLFVCQLNSSLIRRI
jgi:hypothetical protein